MALGLLVAIFCAYGKSAGPRPVRWLVAAYVELIRNTPFLVQIFIFYFSLPVIGLKRLQIFRFIIIFPALKTVYPALASQFILLMLSSSVVSTISAVELTAITNSLASTTFRAFEFYFVATGLYLAMALGFRAGLSAIYWAVFQRGRAA